MNEEENPTLLCRYCFCQENKDEEGGNLIAPCACRGSQKWCHESCLIQWQTSVVQENRNLHPSRTATADERQTTCNVCKTKFTLVPPSRADILRLQLGKDIVSSISKGSFLVATQKQSRDMSDRLDRIPEPLRSLIILKRAHWKKSIYFIFSVGNKITEDGSSEILALNLTRKVGEEDSDDIFDYPIPNKVKTTMDDAEYKDDLCIHHFNGGPVGWSKNLWALIVISSSEAKQMLESLILEESELESTQDSDEAKNELLSKLYTFNIKGTNESSNETIVVVGGLEQCLKIAQTESRSICSMSEMLRSEVQPGKVILRTFSGHARWSHTQLMGEIARGSWGVAKTLQDNNLNLSNVPAWDKALSNSLCYIQEEDEEEKKSSE